MRRIFISTDGVRGRGVVDDTQLERMMIGAEARFIADDASVPVQRLRLVQIAAASNGRLAEPVLAEKFGGAVAATEDKGEIVVRQGWADVHFDADDRSPPQAIRGLIRIEATSVSPLRLIFNQIARVLVREHGF